MKIDMTYVMKKEVLDAETIKGLHIYEDERRKIRTGKVKDLRVNYSSEDKNKRHWDSPLVLNKISNTQRSVIDGNHRVESIKDKIEQDPSFSILVWVAEYKELTRDQEREIYSKWNKGTPESSTDYLKWHWKTLPLAEKLIKKLPISIYGSKLTIQAKNFIGSYVMAKRGGLFKGGYDGVNGEKTVADFQALTKDDITIMEHFYKEYSVVFGEFDKDVNKIWYGTTPLCVMFRLWYDHKEIIRIDDYNKILNKTFLQKQLYWSDYLKMGGREAQKIFYDKALKEINLKYGKKYEIIDAQYVQE